MSDPDAVHVGFDVGPLHGRRTGVGNAVTWLLDELEDRPGLRLTPYVTSARARLVPPQRRLPLPAALAHRLWSRLRAPRLDRFLGHPDVVHGTNYVVPPVRCARLVAVYDCWFLDHPAAASPEVRRAGRALRRAVDGGAVVVTSSEATTQRVRALLDPDDVRTIHLGPPPASGPQSRLPGTTAGWALAGQLTGRPFVLALGTVERRKDLPTLVAAFELAAPGRPDLRLVVVGPDGDAAADLAARIARLDRHLAERVVRADHVDGGTKAWLLDHAAVLAYPSLDEGFGFPILEAQQAGTPVVGSEAGSIGEVAGEGALLGPPRDPHALAANIEAVLDPAIRSGLVASGTANLSRFSWRATGDAYQALYRELARR